MQLVNIQTVLVSKKHSIYTMACTMLIVFNQIYAENLGAVVRIEYMAEEYIKLIN